ncbi:polysaccharide deacetylase family protein [Selenomonas sp. FC4001]|uniref:polysaccharide deacetylase family protein n=1 Tax=Selenomonas sp. FC4001 TaxID=1408313 RepID=UPI00055BE0F0|nr:polysaccharide deacetylase family protein [Selenomonas sp. FC4001]
MGDNHNILIKAPKDGFSLERKYIFEVIFKYFIGIPYELIFEDRREVCLQVNNKRLYVNDVFFDIKADDYLTERSMPIGNLPVWYPQSEEICGVLSSHYIPIIFGNAVTGKEYVSVQDEDIRLGIDIFGAAFFMLSRYEEFVVKDRDHYDRFPVESSLAYKFNFLERPIINEYIEILWYLLKKMDSALIRKVRKYKVIPTHDIDRPFGMLYDTPLQIMRHFAGDIVYRRSFSDIIGRIRDTFHLCFCKEIYVENKNKVFSFISKKSVEYHIKSIFFFMNSKRSLYDGNYMVNDPDVLDAIKNLVSEGHHIGLHPSFDSYLDRDEIKEEVAFMNEVFIKNQLPPLVGARQHYLKWKNPDTWQYYEDAGISFDSTMTYAGHVGFRCGVCYPFPVFNLKTRKQLALIEHPLIIMDGTLYDDDYMGLSHDEAMPVIKKLADECKKYNGEFVILWHNTMLDDKNEREFYSAMLDEVCGE